MLDTFYLSLKFFLKYYFNKLCFQLPQKCNVISSSTGINGVRLAHHISLEASMTGGHIVSHCFFETAWQRAFRESLKKKITIIRNF